MKTILAFFTGHVRAGHYRYTPVRDWFHTDQAHTIMVLVLFMLAILSAGL